MNDEHEVLLSGAAIKDALTWLESVDGHDIAVATDESLTLYDALVVGFAACKGQTPIWGNTVAELVLTGAESALLVNIFGRPR